MTKSPVRQIPSNKNVPGIEDLAEIYGELKSEWEQLKKIKHRLHQAAALRDPKTRAKTLVDLAVEGTYKIAEALAGASNQLPVIGILKRYYQIHFKVLAACAQALYDSDRAEQSLQQLKSISQSVMTESPEQLRNYRLALTDQIQATRSEVALLRLFRPAGYKPTGIVERISATLFANAKDSDLRKAFPDRRPEEIKRRASQSLRNAEFQSQVDESLRDNRDLAFAQLAEVTAAALTYKKLLWSAYGILLSVETNFDNALAGKGSSFDRIVAATAQMNKDFAEYDGTILSVNDINRFDSDWTDLVSDWQKFEFRLSEFKG